ncbi:phosphotransferase enzyme family-domain-containing protein [Diaporthe sp. PMI_573]|nr:phosphotransferase enzyme family-domain-containing protein [Diaporthaceae sp. PMI_573]
MPSHSQEGLKWDRSGLDLVPLWTRQPSTEAIETVCRQRLHIGNNANCSISFHAEGSFNKLYLVRTDEQSLLIRISLPVCPHDKTRGEVTTLRWLAENTNIPVPKVIAFDDISQNEIGFEWILMELMPGASAWKQWRSLTMAQKLVSNMFFMGNHINYDGVHRGPFRSSHDWLKSYLDIAMREFEDVATNGEDEDEIEEAEDALEVAGRLITLLPKIFSPIKEPSERTALMHDDLGLQNILLDEQGNISAVLDWECVSAMPLWAVTQVPKFLRNRDREDEPKRESYPDEPPPPKGGSDNGQRDPDDLKNEGKNGLYWINLMEYETTQLRKIYHDKMRSFWPDWDLCREENRLKLDFYDAVARCAGGVFLKRLRIWVDRIEAGDFVRLQTVLSPV